MEEVVEKPVQKLTTAGAERVPPAPWVKMKGAGFTGDFSEVMWLYWWQTMGLLTSSELMVKLVAVVEAEVAAGLPSTGAVGPLFVSGFDLDSTVFFACFTFALLVAVLGFLLIFVVILALSSFVLKLSFWDFSV